MKKVWIIVANSGQSKVYCAENSQHLVEHAIFFNDERHIPAHDLVCDRQGREANQIGANNKKGWSTDTYEAKTPVELKIATAFAETLAHFLEKKYTEGECGRVYLIAKDHFLGHLRNAISSNVTKLIHGEINKDLTHLSPEAIREYLPPVL